MAPTIDLTAFCDPDISRYALQRPWRIGNFVQATDGRAAIQVDAALVPEIGPTDGRVPRFDDVIGPIDKIKEWEPCPTVADCADCQNTGQNLVECDFCKGTGLCECGCGNEHDCGQCGDAGVVGEGWCESCTFFFRNRQLQHKYMLAIAKLPQCELGAIGNKPGNPVYFRFKGGCGAIMPCNEDRSQ